jgi:crossover junction endodeoxyribonuclease RusA
VSLTITIPLPPSVNAMYRALGRGGKGRNILSKEARLFYEKVVPLIQQQAEGWFVLGDCELSIGLWFPDRRRCDVSNRVKAAEDACTKAGVWKDDSQVRRLVVERMGVDKGCPRAELVITAL